MITSSMPSARIALYATCLVIVIRFVGVKKASDRSEKMITSTMSATNARWSSRNSPTLRF